MKKLAALLLTLVLVFSLASCGAQSDSPAAGTSADTAAPSYKIGVIQYATHASLDDCYKGFLAGLKEAGIVEGENLTIDFQNANGESSNSDLQAKNMVTAGYDLIMAIATPAAMSAYSAAKDTDIPVVFNAVSDPLAAGIVQSLDKPGTNCTGSSDVLNFDKQLEMIRAFLPKAATIGVIYTTSEANSVSQLARLEEAAKNYDFTIESVGVTNASEVGQAAATLIAKKVDCLTNLTDNNVVDNLSTVLHATDEAGIPVFGSEVQQVVNGCLASESIDYVGLGKVTGEMAAKILKGEATASDLAVSTESTCTPVYSSAVAEKLGLKLPKAFADAQDVAA